MHIAFNIEHKTKQMPLTATDNLKLRILKAKTNKLPYQITAAFCNMFPAYDNEKGRKRVTEVLHTKYADKDITEKFETLVAHFKTNGYV